MTTKLVLSKPVLWTVIIVMLFIANWAQALTTCSVSSPGFASGYVPLNLTTNITSATFDVTCSRDNSGGPAFATVQYDLSVNNGIYALGTQNRAALAGSFLNYHLATDPACSIPWSGATVIPTPSASFPLAKNSVVTNTHTFYGCILPGQLVLPPEGSYTDTITMTFSLAKATGQSAFSGGAFPVTIVAPASCNITTPPANVNFTYTAFSPAAVLASSTIGVRCTTFLAYTMALDATIDVLTGLNYSLALNNISSGGVNPLSSVGNGVTQTFFINGTMAAGQAGTCASAACSGTQTRTLTITY
jgi:spore coat protein U-like protein